MPASNLIFLIFALCLFWSTGDLMLLAQCDWVEEQKLTASDAAPGDGFGHRVSVSGDVCVVGARDADNPDTNSGSAYVYRFVGSTWIEEQELTASDGAAGDEFGNWISVSGDVCVVGAIRHDNVNTDAGSAYVYRFNGMTWVEEQKLTANDAAAFDAFGKSVSVRGDVVVVGAFHDDDACPGDPDCNSGSAYVYRYDATMLTWVEEQKLTASDGAAVDQFGVSVAVSGDVCVVGAFSDDGLAGNDDSGSAYVYRFNGSTWVEEQKLTASDGEAFDIFGWSVSVSGDVVVVGVQQEDSAGTNSGSAYVYRYDATMLTWVEEQKLTASDGAAFDTFGFSVSVSGDFAVVGAVQHDSAGDDSGSAYVYHFDGLKWIEKQKLTASDGAAFDKFGRVSVSDEVCVVGAREDDDAGPDSGSVYVFRLTGDSDFMRGDCDGDGGFNGLLDGLKALSFQFIPGTPPPPCLVACDFDDDGVFNGLLDGLGILNFQFVQGSPPPAPPWITCGLDPTPDGLDCADSPCP